MTWANLADEIADEFDPLVTRCWDVIDALADQEVRRRSRQLEADRFRKRSSPLPDLVIVCVNGSCGVEFVSKNPRVRYCTARCSFECERQRNLARQRGTVAAVSS